MRQFPESFAIELTLPELDLYGELNDGLCAGLRYRADDPKFPPAFPSRSTQLSSREQQQLLAADAISFSSNRSRLFPSDITPIASTPFRIPVHSDLGPAPALDDEEGTADQWLISKIDTEGVGDYRQVIATLRTGNPDRSKETRTFPVEMDLGSHHMWIYGAESKKGNKRPKGIESLARFWSFMEGSTNRSHSPQQHTAKYGDGSFVHYKLFCDYIYFKAHRPPSTSEPDRSWLWMTFGVAHEVSPDFESSPASGILGLGRKMGPLPDIGQPLSFLQQVQSELQSPELVILLGTRTGTITFGKRAIYTLPQEVACGPWHNNIAVVEKDHWAVSSTKKILNGKEYIMIYKDGKALLDTGAAYCYMDPKFTKDVYSFVPGSIYRRKGETVTVREMGYYFIPADLQSMPNIQFDIGGQLFVLEHFSLPKAKPPTLFEGKPYVMGAVQSTSLLYPEDVRPYVGPDIIGRVALINMELVLQFPVDKPHTVSWRRKDRNVVGVDP
ncbi:aspartic peptidase domain-containing protein [Mycena latifolia]|nr:aspartic peptidase domain-containing protein [Mycena latifolia]